MSWSRKRYPVKTGAITYNCAFEICVCVKYGLFEPGTLPKCCTLKEGITKEFCDLKGGAVTEMRLLKVSLIPEGALETRELSEVSPVESCLPDELGIHEPETSCKPRTAKERSVVKSRSYELSHVLEPRSTEDSFGHEMGSRKTCVLYELGATKVCCAMEICIREISEPEVRA